jgi:hypothetical protein
VEFLEDSRGRLILQQTMEAMDFLAAADQATTTKSLVA